MDYKQSEYIIQLFEQYKADPSSVDESWQKFFEGLEFGITNFAEEEAPSSSATPASNNKEINKQIGVLNMIHAYRSRGHLISDTNPIRPRKDHKPRLDLADFGLSEGDLQSTFQAGSELGIGTTTLAEIWDHLKTTYCGKIGVEFMHMRKPDVWEWLRSKMEPVKNKPNFSIEEKKMIAEKLNGAEVFEKFLQTKYMGQKRFSLEGAEVIIPGLEGLIRKGADLGAKQFIIGMAHRGRLNVLANILEKTYEDIFAEFEDFGKTLGHHGTGDVKYHMGHSTIRNFGDDEDIKLTLAFNPSHLEAIDTVVAGMTRAKAEQWFNSDMNQIVPILIHGDAAISGQGIVYEHLQMSSLDGYNCGGTIHVVINNQIGFTTNYEDSRSSIYCTDIAKTNFAPVFHVNGHDPEAVVHVLQLATEFRQKYSRDVFVDIVCSRKYGHNETDEPRFTQPIMYKQLEKLKSVRELYMEQLHETAVLEDKLSKQMEKDFKDLLQNRMEMAKEEQTSSDIHYVQSKWSKFERATAKDFETSPRTRVEKQTLVNIVNALSSVPDEFKPIRKVTKLLKTRKDNFEADKIDWAMGELLAYGTLLLESHPIRISGQDVQRGTFSHRHAVIKDETTEEEYVNLNHLREDQSNISLHNSLLSEYGVLGFEYGYSLSTPRRLTIWEAQFGDFANGAQIMIDQFISSAEEKWGMYSGLVVLLPHGYEGQGPEHSSARPERFLQLCAKNNMIIANCTSPGNYFHLLRRQMKWNFRKPLIVFTPKSLLRHPECVSDLDAFTTKDFEEVIDDKIRAKSKVKKLLFCTGKVYYDLDSHRRANKLDDVAIVRIEQLYPIHDIRIDEIVASYKNAKEFVWVQEEPINMGAWDFIKRKLDRLNLTVVSRESSPSPAGGSMKRHNINQENLIKECFRKGK